MLAEQAGTCAICGNAPDPKQTLAVDHCHETGTVRGLLCHKCNSAIGLLNDSPETALVAAAYLSIGKEMASLKAVGADPLQIWLDKSLNLVESSRKTPFHVGLI